MPSFKHIAGRRRTKGTVSFPRALISEPLLHVMLQDSCLSTARFPIAWNLIVLLSRPYNTCTLYVLIWSLSHQQSATDVYWRSVVEKGKGNLSHILRGFVFPPLQLPALFWLLLFTVLASIYHKSLWLLVEKVGVYDHGAILKNRITSFVAPSLSVFSINCSSSHSLSCRCVPNPWLCSF